MIKQLLFSPQQGNKIGGKENPRSRIPRLVLRSVGPKQKGPSFLGEGTVDFGRSSDCSKGTISISNSSSGDPGFPKRQVTPPLGRDNNQRSPAIGERKRNRKTVRVYVMTACSALLPRHKKEQRLSNNTTGGKTDTSSSGIMGGGRKSQCSSTASATGKKAPQPHSHITSSRSLREGPKLCGQDSENCGPYRTHERVPFLSTRSCLSASATGHYHSCGDNHGIQPPSPEQYLTPLQQKEVVIRHLRSKLKESESRSHKRELEVEELKAQLSRMREDWIEEECHRVEAQLALKEARKEIAQLRQVVETMRSSLVEKDKGIQKYFIDINIQNRKLEALLRIMEMAQNGSPDEEPGLEDQAAQEMTDSGLVISDEGAYWTDASDHTAADDSDSKLEPSKLETLLDDEFCEPFSSSEVSAILVEKAVQTDTAPGLPDLQALLVHLLKLREASISQSMEAVEPLMVTTADPKPAPPTNHIVGCSDRAGQLTGQQGMSYVNVPGTAVVSKRYWSSSFLVDLAALAAPVLPTVAWLYCTHRAGTEPVYNIGALIRGCCIVGLRSLRRMSLGPGTCDRSAACP